MTGEENQQYLDLIEEMVEQRKSEPMDQKLANTRERNIRVAGIIRDYLAKKYRAEVIVTGGLSVEYYTEGRYTTQDIDLITQSQQELEAVLTQLGFEKEGKYWVHDPLEIVIEVVASVPFDGVYKQPQETVTEDGYSIRFVNIHDIIMDRVRGIVHWKAQGYGEQLLALIDRHLQELDMDYLEKNLAGRDEYETLLYHIKLLQEEESIETQAYQVKQALEKKGIPFSEIREGEDLDALAFPLHGGARNELGTYFGLLLVPYIDVLLYNEEEEEFEQQDSSDPMEALEAYSRSYGEPFSSIIEALKRGVVE